MGSIRTREGAVVLGDGPRWYKDAVIYEVPVKAFADSNDDGIGDLPGLTSKLDYLRDLGVTTLWLLPFYPSPLKDDGYDIADYTSVHPSYGTLADFQHFLQEAHRRGLRVITELVLNHTSDQHPWFQRSRRAPAGSTERDFYVWSDTKDKYRDARIIFKDFEPSNWTWDPVAGAHFWHRFYAHQPDLNYDNPAVQQAALEALDFWLDMGVDGLRLDAVPYLFEREGTDCENLPETHAYLKTLRQHVDEKYPGRMLLAEANMWPEDAVAYFGNGDECHMAFHFPVMPRLFMAIRMEDRFPILDILQQTPAIPESCQWAMFLRNHDELTLEMVTDEDRDYMWRIYAQDPQARINLGIRRRLAPLLENHRPWIELMNSLLFSLPGTPVLYYGDEIGMGDNIYLGDRHGVRTPMQWSGERNAGFSLANPQRLFLPVVIDPAYHYEAVNVEAQQNDPHSLLWWTKRLIGLRRRYRSLSRGSLEFVSSDNPKVLAFVRRHESECLLVVANLSRHVQHVDLELSEFEGLVPVEVQGRNRFPAIGAKPYVLTLGSHDSFWFSLEPARRAAPEAEALPALESIGAWDAILAAPAGPRLLAVLEQHLVRASWFQGVGRLIDGIALVDAVPVPFDSTGAQLVIVDVAYTEGDPETYVLPLGFRASDEPEPPATALARLTVRQSGSAKENAPSTGFLYDPLGDEQFARALAEAAIGGRRLQGRAGAVVGLPLDRSAQVPAAPVVMRRKGRNDTSVVFDDALLMKVVRRAEPGVHPETEIGHFLHDREAFPNVPRVVGSLEYRSGRGQPMTVAILQAWVAHEGDGWHHSLNALGRYFEHALTTREKQPPMLEQRHSLLDLAAEEIPEVVPRAIGPFLEAVRLLAQRTAGMHLALASAEDDPAFAPEPFTPHYQRSLYQAGRTRLRRALSKLRRTIDMLQDTARDDARYLLDAEDGLLRRTRRIAEQAIAAQRIRVHGDYHLGHVLYTGKDFAIIDFGGPATAPMSDRCRKRSPLRDVAAMLLSFRRAAAASLQKGDLRPEDMAIVQPWAECWQRWVCVGFLKTYLEETAAAAFLPAAREELRILMEFSMLDRAVHELSAHLDWRTDQVALSLTGLRQLVEEWK